MSLFDGDMYGKAAEDVLGGLSRAGLDPATFGPLQAQLERPQLQHLSPSLLDFIAPVVQSIAEASNPRRDRRNTWLAPALSGLAHGYTGYRKGQAGAIDEANRAEMDRVKAVNAARMSEATGNRSEFSKAVRGQTVDGVLKTRRQIVEAKQREAAEAAKATAKARVQGENEARKEAGVPPVGKTAAKGPAASKPATSPKFSPTSWKLYSDVDKEVLDSIDSELKALKSDPVNSAAFRPPPRSRNGKPAAEDARTTETRKKIADLNSRKFSATKRAILFHLENLPPSGELYVFKQLHSAAEQMGYADKNGNITDPELNAAFDAAAEKLLPGKDK